MKKRLKKHVDKILTRVFNKSCEQLDVNYTNVHFLNQVVSGGEWVGGRVVGFGLFEFNATQPS